MAKLAIVRKEDNAVIGVLPRPEGEKEIRAQYSFPNGVRISPLVIGWSDDEYAVLDVTEFALPDGKQKIGAASYEVSKDVVVETFQVEDAPPPDRVTSRQFKLQLLSLPAIGGGETLLDDVEAWISTQPRAVQVAFENSGSFVRTEPMMQSGFRALGFSEAAIDTFFTEASAL